MCRWKFFLLNLIRLDKYENIIDADRQNQKWNHLNDDQRCWNSNQSEKSDRAGNWQKNHQNSNDAQNEFRLHLNLFLAKFLHETDKIFSLQADKMDFRRSADIGKFV